MSGGLLDSARDTIAGLLELGRTRFELFGAELREELARLATTVLGGLAVLMLAALGLAFGAAAIVMSVAEENRLAAALWIAGLFIVAAALVGWQVKRLAAAKPRAFDATISEIENDLKAIKP
jgi:uncharacterized membrane protein YqjE